MKDSKYVIPSFGINFFLAYIICVIVLPVIGFLSWSIIGLPGESVLLVFWLLFFWVMVKLFKSRSERTEITDSGIYIYQHKKMISFGWNEIEKIGCQVVIVQRMGTNEGFLYLSINVVDQSVGKLDILKSSNEFGFIRKAGDFTNYMGKDRMDLYINMHFIKEKDSGLFDLLSFKPGFVKTIPPLIKTRDKEEYEKILKENFKLNK